MRPQPIGRQTRRRKLLTCDRRTCLRMPHRCGLQRTRRYSLLAMMVTVVV